MFNIQTTHRTQTSVTYIYLVLLDKCIKPDSKKIKAIEEFARPTSVEDLRILCMVIYLAKFKQYLSCLTHTLRQLRKKDYVWMWDEDIQRDFEFINK